MAASSTTNTAALASPIYNPSIDSTTQTLFNIMDNTSYPPDVVSQYTQMITALPTASAFQGLLVNPRACEISDAQTSNLQLQSAIQSVYEGILTAGTRIPALTESGYYTGPDGSEIYTPSGTPGQPGYIPTDEQIQTLNDWQAAMPAINSDLNQVSSTMNDFQDHTDRLISNFPSILGMIQGALGLASSLQGLLNPCIGSGDFLGSILDKGKALMAKIMSQINQAIAYIEGQINAAVAEVQQFIAKIMAQVSAAISMVEEEIGKLVKALIDSARLGLAQLLSLLPKDPCFSSILKTLGTGALQGTLNI